MPQISLIVPVYNAEQYLSRCIDSILNQSFKDFELILVNDGSKDNSLEICNQYSGSDARVIIVSQENGGASSARNHGIEVAKGDFICFVDADDYVTSSYLEQLVRPALQKDRIDLVLQGRIKCESGQQIKIAPDRDGVYFLSEDPGFFKDVSLFRFCSVFSKLFKRDIIHDHKISFSKSMNHGEDFDFLANYLLYCDGVEVSTCANYYYMINPGSLSDRFAFFENEYYCLSQMSDSLLKLSQRFHYEAIDEQVNEFLAYYTAKVLTSVYAPPRPDRSVRINQLRSIDDDFVQLYRKYFVPPTRNGRILKLLYVNKCYRLFDVANMLWRCRREKGTMN